MQVSERLLNGTHFFLPAVSRLLRSESFKAITIVRWAQQSLHNATLNHSTCTLCTVKRLALWLLPSSGKLSELLLYQIRGILLFINLLAPELFFF